jgi:hypothetical protein
MKHVKTLRLIHEDPRVMERFWAQVEKGRTDEDCWEWQGKVTPSGHPCFHLGQHSVAPGHLSWFWSTGELPTCGRVQRLCENPLCVRPRHLAWIIGRTAERRALAETDGYQTLPGIVVPVDHPRFGMPHVVRLASDGPAADGDARSSDTNAWAASSLSRLAARSG